jgi:hypothetical protein
MKSTVETVKIAIKTDKKPGETVTTVEITPDVEIAAEDGYIRVWCPGREIRIGPLTRDHVAALEDDIGYVISPLEDEDDERRTESRVAKVRRRA